MSATIQDRPVGQVNTNSSAATAPTQAGQTPLQRAVQQRKIQRRAVQRLVDQDAAASARDGAGAARDRVHDAPADARSQGNDELGRRVGSGASPATDGSGDWGHDAGDRGVTDRANWYMWSRVALAAETMGLINAARHMRHYLGNTGANLRVPVDFMLRDVPAFAAAFDDEFQEAKTQVSDRLGANPVTTHQNFQLTGPRSSNVYCNKSESQDWFFAVGGFTHWWTVEVTVIPGESGASPQIEMLFTMHVHDRYNWDQGKAVTIAGITVKDEQLGRLHRVGLAQEYDVDGDSTAKFVRWTHSGAAPSPQPNQAPGADERDGSRGDPGRERGRYADDVRGSGGTPRGR